ncbi:SusD/RagB family nutrient-binding outer membrane lipoprotein [Danxiaibacter flavus]|uniref:SusD/RagB family nutrient-binding outer membrane lipoprotein n=1 Tax=Danxiaibacter flavus TaxID=3049108 RepID=A0ABV3ZMA8_9BACT|nr:SusD/RagB family nutrient-binding outer membrane lipoprotein [Chitinophagaceae bacterium DXS]
MKKIIHILIFPVLIIMIGTGCKKSFDTLNQNPNKPTSVPSSLLLNGILNDIYDGPAGDYEKWGQYFLQNYDYYGNNKYEFGSGADYYATLRNVIKMEEEAVKSGLPAGNAYEAMAKFLKAYLFVKMSLEMGDLPMNNALRGSADLTPVYNTQKEVFQQAFVWLDSANLQLGKLVAAGETSLSGDIYFSDNNIAHWQKVTNAFRLRALIHLSKKVTDADLKIKEQFAAIVQNPTQYPLMDGSGDNFQYTFIHPTNDYPQNPGSFGFNALRENCSATYVGLLTKFKDPRVYMTTEPASALVAAGTPPTSYNAFVGADPGEDLGIMYVKANAGQYSLINRHYYYETYTAEPSVQVGYPEMCFNIAEAINRGWIAAGPKGNAEYYYQEGIKASRASYGIPVTGNMTVYFLKSGSPGSSAVYNTYTAAVDYDTYYNQPLVKYSGNNGTGLTQILQQRYIALFRHSGLESYYTYRRTGVPTFTTGPGTGNSGRIAMRFQYPNIEKVANAENYQAALQAQYGGNDDINGLMWLLK